jgi:hypothetical protein
LAVQTIYALLAGWLAVWSPVGGSHAAGAFRATLLDPRPYTLTMPTAQMVSLLKTQLFVDSGRLYPCRGNPACSAWGQNLALSAPTVQIDGPRLVFSVHVSGTYAINSMIAPSIAGDLVVSAVPVARDGLIHTTQSNVQAGPTSDITFQAFVQTVHGQLEQMLNEKGALDLAQYLAMSAQDPKLPPPRLPGVKCVDRSQIHLQSIATEPASSSVTAMVVVSPPGPGSHGC